MFLSKTCLFGYLLYFTFLTLSGYDFGIFKLKPTNVKLCHEPNEQNEKGDDECEEYEDENEVPKYVAEEFWQFESKHKPNLEETVNF